MQEDLKIIQRLISDFCEGGRDFQGLLMSYTKGQENIIYFDDGTGVSKGDLITLEKLKDTLNILFTKKMSEK